MNMNTNSHLNPKSLRQRLRWRFNPMRNLTVDSLAHQLDAFEAGNLREAAETWDTIEKRDDILRSVIPKRKKAIARNGWVVLPARDLQPHETAESKRHIAALEYFYRNLDCSNAIDCNERGGFSLLLRQMMDAVGKRYAAHEIIWRPKADGTLTASFRFVPLAFFENTTGQLRFLESDGATEGTPLKEGEWMVTVGDGLMMASSIAWMFKHLSMNDWALYSEHNGTPGLRASTDSARDSEDWQAIEEAVKDLYDGLPVVTNTGEDIKVVDLAVGGNIPFPALVERMDRVMAAMWRGADLSTLSRDRGYGASLQEKESCVLEEDDAQTLNETLHRYVDRWVIRYLFGENVEPLARVKILVSGLQCTMDDTAIDEFLLKHGAPLAVADVMERYGRPLPRPGEALLTPGVGAGAGVAAARSTMPMSSMQNTQGAAAGRLRGGSAGLEEGFDLTTENTESTEKKGGNGGATHGAGLANSAESGVFQLLQKEWVQLSPYGDFPHVQGLQRVTFEAAREMERRFTSLASRAARLFAGAPMFVGHPDVPQLANQFPDRKAYGWIMALEARPDGLYGKMKWSPAGVELLENGHYKFLSPYWEAQPIGKDEASGRPIFEPVALISAGLTNEPNLPVLPLANTSALQDARGAEAKAVEQAGDAAARASVALTNEKVASAIHEALANGRLTPGQLVAVQRELETDWETGSARLRSAPVVMHTRAYTEKLGERKIELSRFYNRRGKLRDLVAAKVERGMSYDEAWSAVKEECPGLFV